MGRIIIIIGLRNTMESPLQTINSNTGQTIVRISINFFKFKLFEWETMKWKFEYKKIE